MSASNDLIWQLTFRSSEMGYH